MRRDLIALPDESKVWIYQADHKIDVPVTDKIKSHLYDFTMSWQSHGAELDCYGHVFHNRFLVLVTDESNHPSGCSIDSSVHFVKSIGAQYGIDFFDRLKIGYIDDNEIKLIHKNEFKQAYDDQIITGETLMFNNLVKSKSEFLDEWVVPLKDSWYMKWIA